jgi:hypothetical protein
MTPQQRQEIVDRAISLYESGQAPAAYVEVRCLYRSRSVEECDQQIRQWIREKSARGAAPEPDPEAAMYEAAARRVATMDPYVIRVLGLLEKTGASLPPACPAIDEDVARTISDILAGVVMLMVSYGLNPTTVMAAAIDSLENLALDAATGAPRGELMTFVNEASRRLSGQPTKPHDLIRALLASL